MIHSHLQHEVDNTFSNLRLLIQTLINYSPHSNLGKDPSCDFQLTNQFARPEEFLQSLLDIIRVIFEPRPPGTFFLNSNLDFLTAGIPEGPFKFGYISLVSNAGQTFGDFWAETVTPYLNKHGYHLANTLSGYAVVSTDGEHPRISFVDHASTTLSSCFGEEDVVDMTESFLEGEPRIPRKTIYSGFCIDPALDDKIRLSLWLFLSVDNKSTQ